MGRYKDYRERPSRGYDDDRMSNDPMEHWTAPQAMPSPASASSVVDAVVKWFNAEKGFGFIALPDGSEAFLHIRQLEAVGHGSPSEGARLKVRLGQGHKGPEVTAVVGVEAGELSSQSRSERSPAATVVQGRAVEPADGSGSLGTVRMYKTDKGFGFIGMDDGGKDAFVHASTLEQSGLSALKEGDRVRVKIAQGQKGLEVRAISLL